MTSRPAAPESETPETDAFAAASSSSNPLRPHEMLAFAKRLEHRLSLAQTEIKGHMRVVDDLRADLREANAAAQRWYLAASPYATPTALREALVEVAKTNEAPQELPEHTDGQSARVGSSQHPAVASPYALAAMAKLLLAACVDYDGSQEVNGAQPVRIPTCGLLREAADRLVKASARISELEKDATRLDWLENHHTLHTQVDILYVVDGYQVTLMHEDGFTTLSPAYEGHDLRSAIDAALKSRA